MKREKRSSSTSQEKASNKTSIQEETKFQYRLAFILCWLFLLQYEKKCFGIVEEASSGYHGISYKEVLNLC